MRWRRRRRRRRRKSNLRHHRHRFFTLLGSTPLSSTPLETTDGDGLVRRLRRFRRFQGLQTEQVNTSTMSRVVDVNSQAGAFNQLGLRDVRVKNPQCCMTA